MKRRFLHKNFSSLEISKTRFVTGLILGLFYSFSFYGLFYLIREILRILSFFINDINVWIFSDKEVYFYNLILAIVSVTFGLSICFLHWLDRPKRPFMKDYARVRTIINDQRVLKWSFLNWLIKVGLIYSSLLCLAFLGEFYKFSLYPKYNHLFVLIVIVLFLQPWNTIRLIFKNQSFKWTLVAGLIIFVIGYGLSRINLIDYNAINEKLLERNSLYRYDINLPSSEINERLYDRSSALNFFLSRQEDQSNENPLVIFNNKILRNEKIRLLVNQWKAQFIYSYQNRLVARVGIDSSVKMKFINDFKSNLIESEIYKVAYIVVPANQDYPSSYYMNNVLFDRLPRFNLGFITPKEVFENVSKFKNLIHIKHSRNLIDYLVNDSTISQAHLPEVIKRKIPGSMQYLIRYDIEDEADFQSYIYTLSSCKKAIWDIRNSYCKEEYGKGYEELDYDIKYDLNEKFELYMVEFTEEMINEIE